jgi:hypothetical protein
MIAFAMTVVGMVNETWCDLAVTMTLTWKVSTHFERCDVDVLMRCRCDDLWVILQTSSAKRELGERLWWAMSDDVSACDAMRATIELWGVNPGMFCKQVGRREDDTGKHEVEF